MVFSYNTRDHMAFVAILTVVLMYRRGLPRDIAYDIALAYFAWRMSRTYLLNYLDNMNRPGFQRRYGPGF